MSVRVPLDVPAISTLIRRLWNARFGFNKIDGATAIQRNVSAMTAAINPPGGDETHNLDYQLCHAEGTPAISDGSVIG